METLPCWNLTSFLSCSLPWQLPFRPLCVSALLDTLSRSMWQQSWGPLYFELSNVYGPCSVEPRNGRCWLPYGTQLWNTREGSFGFSNFVYLLLHFYIISWVSSSTPTPFIPYSPGQYLKYTCLILYDYINSRTQQWEKTCKICFWRLT